MRELKSAADVIEALGGIDAVQKLTGRTYNAVSNWKSAGSFPSNFLTMMTEQLRERGCTAHVSLWRQTEKVQ